MPKKSKRAARAALSFQDELDEGEDPPPSTKEARKMRNPDVGRAGSSSTGGTGQATEEEELTLSLRLLDDTAGAKTLRLTCAGRDTVDTILRRALAASSADAAGRRDRQHELMLAIDHWIVPEDVSLHVLLRRRWAEGGVMFQLGRDVLAVLPRSAYAERKHQFPFQYWEELPATAVSKKYQGSWWQRVPQLNGRPGEKVRMPEWCTW